MAFFGRQPKKPQQLGRIEGGRTQSGLPGDVGYPKPGRPGDPGARPERVPRAVRSVRVARAERRAR